MNRIIEQKVKETENQEIRRAVEAWDQRANEDYLRLLELAYERPGYFAHLARRRAPNAFVRVGAKKKAA